MSEDLLFILFVLWGSDFCLEGCENQTRNDNVCKSARTVFFKNDGCIIIIIFFNKLKLQEPYSVWTTFTASENKIERK